MPIGRMQIGKKEENIMKMDNKLSRREQIALRRKREKQAYILSAVIAFMIGLVAFTSTVLVVKAIDAADSTFVETAETEVVEISEAETTDIVEVSIEVSETELTEELHTESLQETVLEAVKLVESFETQPVETEVAIETVETAAVNIEAVKEEPKEKVIPKDITDRNNLAEKIVDEANIYFVNDNASFKVVRTLEISATAYCICEECCDKPVGHKAYGLTKSGLNLTKCKGDPHIVAADWDNIPQGTKIYIEVPKSSRDYLYVKSDYGFATVEDEGGKIQGNKIDIYFPTHEEAIAWGKREVKVYILEN